MGWRFIDSDIADPFYVTAADDAISLARKENKVENTLHFYRRNPPTISIGRSRIIEHDIDLKECMKNNVQIVRRTTGGGTIFTDEKCLIYSLIFHKNNVNLYNTKKIFEKTCKVLTNTLKEFQINTNYKIPNDILLNGKKISGSAQIIRNDIVLIHGTLLLDTNLDLMKKVLKLNSDTNVSTIFKEIGYLPPIKEIKNQLRKEFEKYLKCRLKKEAFSHYEKKLIVKLMKEKYLNSKWNFKR